MRSNLWPLYIAALTFGFCQGGLAQGARAQESSAVMPVRIDLTEIKVVKTTESGGDELYFSVTEYSSLDRPHHYLVPNFPTHWLSDQLSQITDVELWSKKLKQNESVEVLISLLERDAPPWNVDDLIGTVKFRISYVDGELKRESSIPNLKDTQRSADSKNEFVLIGDGGEYNIRLNVEEY